MSRQLVYGSSTSDLYSSNNTFSFGFPPPLSTDHSNTINKKPPVSAPNPLRQKQTTKQARPESLKQGTLATSPESQLLDQWSEDLQEYEMVLDSLASTSLDSKVKEEIKHTDQWYCYLSETERTATMYALLQHSTPLQIRFFITVLQQLGKKDPVSSLLSPVYTEYDTPKKDATTPLYYRDILGSNGQNTTKPKNRQSIAFGELDDSSPSHQAYTSFMEAGELLGSPSPSSSSSGGRHLSDDFIDTPGTQQYSTSASSSSGWPNRSTSTGLRTGNQDPTLSSYYRHISTRPKSADISQWSPSLPSNKSNTNLLISSKPATPFLSLGTGTPPMTPTMPTRISGHFDSLPSPTTSQFSDSILRSTDISNSIDALTGKMNQWTTHPDSNLRRQSQYNEYMDNSLLAHYHHSYPTHYTQKSLMDNTNNEKSVSNRFLHHDHRNRSIPAHRHQYMGHYPKERYSLDAVNLELMQDVPAWLKSLRLHKYTPLFESMTWQAIILLTDEELVEKGVAALGARRKLLKVFDQVKQHCDKMNIKYGPD